MTGGARFAGIAPGIARAETRWCADHVPDLKDGATRLFLVEVCDKCGEGRIGLKNLSPQRNIHPMKGMNVMNVVERTIFDNKFLNPLLRGVSRIILRIAGWKIEPRIPDISKYVMIAAPHTSNWDFVLTVLIAFARDVKIHMMGKKELFKGPFGRLFKWMGVIPIDRSRSNNTVAQVIQLFQNREKLIMVIPPSGTRKRVMKWKTGFYHIAHGAKVPIALGFLDYARKSGGIGRLFRTTGNIEADMAEINAFYTGITGKLSRHASLPAQG